MLLTDVNLALKHAQRIAKQQSPGLFLLSFHRANTGKPFKRVFIDNRAHDFKERVRRLLEGYADEEDAFAFYGVNAYKQKDSAKMEDVAPCTMVHVDADGVALPPPGPKPTTIVRTSSGNYQFIYFLDRAVTPDEAGTISQHLTQLTGGDTGGWSAAKLLRLPGTRNLKPEYGPEFPEVVIVDDEGPTHSADEMLSLVAAGANNRPRMDIEREADRIDLEATKRVVIGRLKGLPNARARYFETDDYHLAGEALHYLTAKDGGAFGDRSDIVFRCALAFKKVGATAAEAAALLRSMALFKARDNASDLGRVIAKIYTSNHVLDPAHPGPSARALVMDNYTHDDGRTLNYYRDEFYEWNGSRYKALGKEEIAKSARHFLEAAKRLDKTGVEVTFKPQTFHVNEVLAALRAEALLSAEIEAPCWLDGTPLDDIMPLRNGLLHVPSRTLHRPTPKYFNLHESGVKYDPNAPKPKGWLKFLDELWPDDDESIEALQDMFGYLLTPDTSQQKIFLLKGPPRSGKGTIAKVIGGLVGEVAGLTSSSFGEPFGLAPLIERTVGIIDDMRSGDSARPSAYSSSLCERLLTISGGGVIPVNRKNKSYWEGRLSTRIIILSNEMPGLKDASGALASRFIVIRMTKSFLEKVDIELGDRLLKELPGILNWALDGYDRLNGRGHFVQPRSAREEIRVMRRSASPIKEFVEECCIVGGNNLCASSKLFDAWKKWCDPKEYECGDDSEFGRKLNAAVPGLKRVQRYIEGKKTWCQSGISLR